MISENSEFFACVFGLFMTMNVVIRVPVLKGGQKEKRSQNVLKEENAVSLSFSQTHKLF